MMTTVDTTDPELFGKVQDAITMAVEAEGAAAGPLAQAVLAGQNAHSLPQSCINPYLEKINCGRPLSEKQRCAALKAFQSVTGYQPFDMTLLVAAYTEQQVKMLNFIAYYIFIPLIIITLIVVWVLVGFGMIAWEAGFWYSVFVITILMIFKVGFSLHGQSWIKKQAQLIVTGVNQSQADFENAVAYFPAAQYAVACAVNGDCWNCDCVHCASSGETCGPCHDKNKHDHDDHHHGNGNHGGHNGGHGGKPKGEKPKGGKHSGGKWSNDEESGSYY